MYRKAIKLEDLSQITENFNFIYIEIGKEISDVIF